MKFSNIVDVESISCRDGRQVRHWFCKPAEEIRMWEHYPLTAPTFSNRLSGSILFIDMKTINLVCKNCEKQFDKSIYEYESCVKEGKINFFCELSCSTSFQQKQRKINNILKYNKNKNCCNECSIELEYKNRHLKFCNHSCSAKFHNRTKKQNFCLYCNSTSRRKFCSINCSLKFKKNKLYKIIEEGKYKGNSNDTVRNYLIEKHGSKCILCGWNSINPITKKCPIILDRIDGNSENWNLNNLRLICPNCDSLTPTYKALNKGNGRFKRRQRYKENKSF